MPRAELLERYRTLPLPTTKDESWRFTDLARLRPGHVRRQRRHHRRLPRRRCSRSTPPASPRVSEAGIEIERAPEGITLRARSPTTRCSARSSARTRSSPRTTPRSGSTACSSTCRRASSSSSRSTSAIANSVPGGSLFWRLLVVAEAESRFTRDRGVRVRRSRARGLLERRRRDLRRAGREARVRLASRTSRAGTWHFASHHARVERDAELDWVAGGFGSAQGQGPDPERPRRPGRDLAGDRRVLRRRRRSTSTTTRSRSTSRRTRRRTSPSRARSATRPRPSGAG